LFRLLMLGRVKLVVDKAHQFSTNISEGCAGGERA